MPLLVANFDDTMSICTCYIVDVIHHNYQKSATLLNHDVMCEISVAKGRRARSDRLEQTDRKETRDRGMKHRQ